MWELANENCPQREKLEDDHAWYWIRGGWTRVITRHNTSCHVMPRACANNSSIGNSIQQVVFWSSAATFVKKRTFTSQMRSVNVLHYYILLLVTNTAMFWVLLLYNVM